MSSYLTLINQVKKFSPQAKQIQFLVSGSDSMIRDRIFADICSQAFANRKNLVILDDSGNPGINRKDISAAGFVVKDGLSGKYGFSNILNTKSMKGISRLRTLLGTMGYSETEKQKLIAYLNFISHLQTLSGADGSAELNMDILGSYSASMLVEQKIQEMVMSGCISDSYQKYLLAKYSEVSSAGADFENILYLMLPFMKGSQDPFAGSGRTAYIFSLKDFSRDRVMKEIVAQMLIDSLEDSACSRAEIVILDEGLGRNTYLPELIGDISPRYGVHILSGDIFSMGDAQIIRKIFNRFTARIYSRHSDMNSCSAISSALGQVQVCKHSYTVTYDRRWRSNAPWDVLLGKNKTEVYGTNAPVWEARYPKEMINHFPAGNGIVEFMGSSSVFTL